MRRPTTKDRGGQSSGHSSRAPIDPRLLRLSKPARRYLVISVALSVVVAAATVVFALSAARILSGVIADPELRSLSPWLPQLVILLAAAAIRVAATWGQERLARSAAGRVVDDLREQVIGSSVSWDSRERRAQAARLDTVLTSGLDGLIPYLASYVPALVLAVVLTPTLVLVLVTLDPLSALVVAVTLPLIPLFMVLIGVLTRGRTEAQMHTMSRLGARTLDLLSGLPTLAALGREHGPQQQVEESANEHRTATMSVLRIAFLSSMVLELLATLCVALVAVEIGLRLVFGQMDLGIGIAVLILAPDVYAPLRAVGARFHESEEGALAADEVLTLLGSAAAPAASSPSGAAPPSGAASQGQAGIQVRALTVRGRDGARPESLSFDAKPGELTVLTGPNGSGKSTVLYTLLGLVDEKMVDGTITIGGVPLTTSSRTTWWPTVAWLPQRPTLVPGTLRENVELFGADPQLSLRAAYDAGLEPVLDRLPKRWDTPLGSRGEGLSQGERHRIALTRLFARRAVIYLVDEPTAHLDPVAASRVRDALRARADAGATVVVAGHGAELLDCADQVVDLGAGGTGGAL